MQYSVYTVCVGGGGIVYQNSIPGLKPQIGRMQLVLKQWQIFLLIAQYRYLIYDNTALLPPPTQIVSLVHATAQRLGVKIWFKINYLNIIILKSSTRNKAIAPWTSATIINSDFTKYVGYSLIKKVQYYLSILFRIYIKILQVLAQVKCVQMFVRPTIGI